MSPIYYLKIHPTKLHKLVDYCKGDANARTQPNVKSTISNDQPQLNNGSIANEGLDLPFLLKEEEVSVFATSPSQKPNPFYVSLYVNGHKLSNYIINFRVFDNVMPSSISHALGLTLTKTFGFFYSMDAK